MTEELAELVEYKKVSAVTDFDNWLFDVCRINDHITAKCLAARARLSRAPFPDQSRTQNTASATTALSSSTPAYTPSSSNAPCTDRPIRLSEGEKELLAANNGCYKPKW